MFLEVLCFFHTNEFLLLQGIIFSLFRLVLISCWILAHAKDFQYCLIWVDPNIKSWYSTVHLIGTFKSHLPCTWYASSAHLDFNLRYSGIIRMIYWSLYLSVLDYRRWAMFSDDLFHFLVSYKHIFSFWPLVNHELEFYFLRK